MAATKTKEQKARDRAILRERATGDRLVDIAKRHRLSIEGVRVVVARQAEREIDALIARLEANVDSGDLEVLLIPNGPDLDVSLAYTRFVLAQLSERGIRPRIHQRAVDSGMALGLELESDDNTPKEASK
jgi:hypothetical protein